MLTLSIETFYDGVNRHNCLVTKNILNAMAKSKKSSLEGKNIWKVIQGGQGPYGPYQK